MRGFAQLVIIVLLLLGIGAGLALLQVPNILKSKAANESIRQRFNIGTTLPGFVDKKKIAPVPTSKYAALSLSPVVSNYNKGCAFSVSIDLDTGGNATDGTDVILLFDPKKFSAKSIKNGSIYKDYPGNNIDNGAGRLVVSGLSSTASPFSGSGTLATVEFTVLENASAGNSQMKFDFDPKNIKKTTDSNVLAVGGVDDILGKVFNASYIVGQSSCNQPAPTPGVPASAKVSIIQSPIYPGQNVTVIASGSPSCSAGAQIQPSGLENCSKSTVCPGDSCIGQWRCVASNSPGGYALSFSGGNDPSCISKIAFVVSPAPTPTPYSSLEIVPKSIGQGGTVIARVEGSVLCSTNSKVESPGFSSCSAPVGDCDSAAATCWGEFSCIAAQDQGNYQAFFTAANNSTCTARSDFQVRSR